MAPLQDSALIPGRLLYVAWDFDVRLLGPAVLSSRVRRRGLAAVKDVMAALERIPELGRLRLFESSVIIPVRNRPRFDVVLLLDGSDAAIRTAREVVEGADVVRPSFIGSASNVEKFGDTDSLDGPILLNHFTSPRSAAEVTEVWRGISSWYGDVLGVDNSTLLAFDAPSPFVAVNYVSIPSSVGQFMVDQVTRPSFYGTVLGSLKTVDTRALPLFARRLNQPVTKLD